jgi:hypothetical protein
MLHGAGTGAAHWRFELNFGFDSRLDFGFDSTVRGGSMRGDQRIAVRGFQRFVVFGCLLLTPAAAFAQASLVGTARDSSGAVLPGVTVEASSPALIEKVRSGVTDGTGVYQIVDLRPGAYTVTFTLTGFNTVKRENIELTGSNTVTVNAEMAVGSVAETLTVTGEAPTVDVQNTARSTVISSEVQTALPTGRSQYAYAVLVPGVTLSSFSGGNLQDVGGTGNMDITIFTVHGSRPFDDRLMINGLTARNLLSSAWASNFVPDMGASAEVAYDYSSGTADAYGAGFSINLIPKEGGNTFHGGIFGFKVGSSWQSNNYTPELQAAGLSSPNKLQTLYDVNPSIGGPIAANHAWFFFSMRWQESTSDFAGKFANANLGNPDLWNYVPDNGTPGVDSKKMNPTTSIRLTWQATPRNKIGFSTDPQERYWKSAVANHAPEADSSWTFQHETFTTVTYSSPITNKLLLDARFGHHAEGFVDDCAPGVNPVCAGKGPSGQTLTDAITVQDLNTGLFYHGNGYCCYPFAIFGTQDAPHIMQAQASLSYVTGAHAMKFGWQNDFGTSTSCQYDNPQGLFYQFGTPAVGAPHVDQFGRSLVPVALEQHAFPLCQTTHLKAEMGIYAQDKWTFKRATINGGLRFDYFANNFPDQTLGPTVWTPNRNILIPGVDHYSMKDLTPRVGLVYDITGDGKTAFKTSWGKYVAGGNAADGNPAANIASRNFRSWTPSLPFGSPNYYTPQCDLNNQAANGDCGVGQNPLFGQPVASAAVDPKTYTGFGNRFYSEEFSVSVQREVIPRTSVDFGYFRRWYGNFQIQKNLAVTAADFYQYSITVPNDSRLPNAGQQLGGFYEVVPALAGAFNGYTTFADSYGGEQEHWNGFDFTVNSRPRAGVTLQGGLSWGRLSEDICALEAQAPELQLAFGILAYSRNDCHVVEPFQTQFKMLGTYLVPKVDVQFGVTFQSAPGPPLGASYFQTAAQAGVPSFSASGVRLAQLVPQVLATAAQNNTPAGSSEYYPRANQLDLRFSKIFRFGMGGRYRATVNFDMANALNSSDVLAFNSTYGAGWQGPLNIMNARLLKLSGAFDF